jgi:hypothetical protein
MMRYGSSREAACNRKLSFEGRFVADRFCSSAGRLEALGSAGWPTGGFGTDLNQRQRKIIVLAI